MILRTGRTKNRGSYLGRKALSRKHGADAITFNWLGGFYGGHSHAYPCLGFHQLNNEALVGGRECAVRSAATLIAGTILAQGRPDYISDPILDTAKRRIVYPAASPRTRPSGRTARRTRFKILTHSEDRRGASVRSLLPTGYLTTTLEFEQGRKEILFHRAKAVANDPDDRACRTKLCAEPLGDLEKLFRQWNPWGWHRVTFYGDLKEPISPLADALGWRGSRRRDPLAQTFRSDLGEAQSGQPESRSTPYLDHDRVVVQRQWNRAGFR